MSQVNPGPAESRFWQNLRNNSVIPGRLLPEKVLTELQYLVNVGEFEMVIKLINKLAGYERFTIHKINSETFVVFPEIPQVTAENLVDSHVIS